MLARSAEKCTWFFLEIWLPFFIFAPTIIFETMSVVSIKDPLLYKDIKAGIASTKQVAEYLLKNYTSYDLALALAEVFITMGDVKPMTITREQFLTYFRIAGWRIEPDEVQGLKGTRETRGSRSKGDD